ncbi:hypothetical protein [Usitatibacter palustris]|uniref:hypothetical protein n=1 Tax=Usitatibacter palustris TaxID=2732487 RepID=UPI0014885F2E|nr:hypothetical protein [Usitatibacter palustris]
MAKANISEDQAKSLAKRELARRGIEKDFASFDAVESEDMCSWTVIARPVVHGPGGKLYILVGRSGRVLEVIGGL